MTINEMKQSYKQSYTDNVELSIFNCGHEPCLSGHTWGPGVRDHYLIPVSYTHLTLPTTPYV